MSSRLASAPDRVNAFRLRCMETAITDLFRILSPSRAKRGVSAYVGDGLNRWPAVHRLDAAHLYRLALEKGSPGVRYHGIADQGIRFREIAEVIGRRLNVPVISKSPEEAEEHFGWISHFVRIDCPASSEDTQRQLGWRPTHASLIPDIDGPTYFEVGTDAASAAEVR